MTEKKPNRKPVDEKTRVKARTLWEGEPSATFASVARAIGGSKVSVSRWAEAEGWEKLKPDMQGLMAHRAVDNYERNLKLHGPNPTEEQKQQASAQASQDTAIEIRKAVLERHQKEWSAPRTISYEAIKERNFEKAKLAKITAETLLLIQSGERKAYGMDAKDPNPKGTEPETIVIERE